MPTYRSCGTDVYLCTWHPQTHYSHRKTSSVWSEARLRSAAVEDESDAKIEEECHDLEVFNITKLDEEYFPGCKGLNFISNDVPFYLVHAFEQDDDNGVLSSSCPNTQNLPGFGHQALHSTTSTSSPLSSIDSLVFKPKLDSSDPILVIHSPQDVSGPVSPSFPDAQSLSESGFLPEANPSDRKELYRMGLDKKIGVSNFPGLSNTSSPLGESPYTPRSPKPATRLLKIGVQLSERSFIKQLFGKSDARYDICINIFFNGEFAASRTVNYDKWLAKGEKKSLYFSGRRIEESLEAPWISFSESNHIRSPMSHLAPNDEALTASQRWAELTNLLLKEANEWGRDSDGRRSSTGNYLELLSKQTMPSDLGGNLGSVESNFGVVDVIISYGHSSSASEKTTVTWPCRRLPNVLEGAEVLRASNPQGIVARTSLVAKTDQYRVFIYLTVLEGSERLKGTTSGAPAILFSSPRGTLEITTRRTHSVPTIGGKTPLMTFKPRPLHPYLPKVIPLKRYRGNEPEPSKRPKLSNPFEELPVDLRAAPSMSTRARRAAAVPFEELSISSRNRNETATQESKLWPKTEVIEPLVFASPSTPTYKKTRDFSSTPRSESPLHKKPRSGRYNPVFSDRPQNRRRKNSAGEWFIPPLVIPPIQTRRASPGEFDRAIKPAIGRVVDDPIPAASASQDIQDMPSPPLKIPPQMSGRLISFASSEQGAAAQSMDEDEAVPSREAVNNKELDNETTLSLCHTRKKSLLIKFSRGSREPDLNGGGQSILQAKRIENPENTLPADSSKKLSTYLPLDEPECSESSEYVLPPSSSERQFSGELDNSSALPLAPKSKIIKLKLSNPDYFISEDMMLYPIHSSKTECVGRSHQKSNSTAEADSSILSGSGTPPVALQQLSTVVNEKLRPQYVITNHNTSIIGSAAKPEIAAEDEREDQDQDMQTQDVTSCNTDTGIDDNTSSIQVAQGYLRTFLKKQFGSEVRPEPLSITVASQNGSKQSIEILDDKPNSTPVLQYGFDSHRHGQAINSAPATGRKSNRPFRPQQIGVNELKRLFGPDYKPISSATGASNKIPIAAEDVRVKTNNNSATISVSKRGRHRKTSTTLHGKETKPKRPFRPSQIGPNELKSLFGANYQNGEKNRPLALPPSSFVAVPAPLFDERTNSHLHGTSNTVATPTSISSSERDGPLSNFLDNAGSKASHTSQTAGVNELGGLPDPLNGDYFLQNTHGSSILTSDIQSITRGSKKSAPAMTRELTTPRMEMDLGFTERHSSIDNTTDGMLEPASIEIMSKQLPKDTEVEGSKSKLVQQKSSNPAMEAEDGRAFGDSVKKIRGAKESNSIPLASTHGEAENFARDTAMPSTETATTQIRSKVAGTPLSRPQNLPQTSKARRVCHEEIEIENKPTAEADTPSNASRPVIREKVVPRIRKAKTAMLSIAIPIGSDKAIEEVDLAGRELNQAALGLKNLFSQIPAPNPEVPNDKYPSIISVPKTELSQLRQNNPSVSEPEEMADNYQHEAAVAAPSSGPVKQWRPNSLCKGSVLSYASTEEWDGLERDSVTGQVYRKVDEESEDLFETSGILLGVRFVVGGMQVAKA